MAALVTALAEELARRDIPLTGDPKRSMFGIHRDVQLLRRQEPLQDARRRGSTRDGTKSCQGLLYVHISPEGSFTAAGFYHPETAQLAALRKAIAADPDRFQELERTLKKSRLALGRDKRSSGCRAASRTCRPGRRPRHSSSSHWSSIATSPKQQSAVRCW